MLDYDEFESINLVEIEEKSKLLLNKFHPSSEIPVPIEEIIEYDLEIAIIPLLNFTKSTSRDGVIAGEFSEIFIDQGILEYRAPLARYVLAREIGHLLLHRDLYDVMKFGPIKEWRNYVDSIPRLTQMKVKYEAHCFAGYILVPGNKLSEKLKLFMLKFHEREIDIDKISDIAWEAAIDELSKEFAVIKDVIRWRIQKENLHDLI